MLQSFFLKQTFKTLPLVSRLLRSKLSVYSVCLTSIVVAIAASIAIYQLNQMAENSYNTRLLLTQIKERFSNLNSLEWEGIGKKKIDENLTEELKENEESTLIILDKLKKYNSNNSFESILELHEKYDAEIKKELNYIRSEQIQKAIDADAIVDKIYDELSAEIATVESIYIQQQEQSRNIADIGTAISLSIAATIIGLVYYKFSRTLYDKNKNLNITLQELRQTQAQLIQQEKMASLGQLIAGIAHEINNPLGAIQASASNNQNALQEFINEISHLYNYLNTQERESFFKLVDIASQNNCLTLSSESRTIKRKLTAYLKECDITDARYIADLLIDMGVSENIEFLLPLLRGERGQWALQMAYNLNCSFINNQTILQAVQRSSKIVFALKNYARFDRTEEKQLILATDGLETTLEIYYNQIKRNIDLVRDYQELPLIQAYPDELIQVWTNLIHNAIQAMPLGGTLTVAARPHNNGVEISIIDTGVGIPIKIQSEIFNAFFTTKPAGEGSGLGLYISKKIIDKHQGNMTVQSQQGKTQFNVWLPV